MRPRSNDHNRRGSRVLLSCLVLVGLSVACQRSPSEPADSGASGGGSGGDGVYPDGGPILGGDGGPLAEYPGFAHTYATAVCDLLISCHRSVADLRADCIALEELNFRRREAVQRGSQSFDPAAGAACLEALRSHADCATPPTESCFSALHPSAGSGHACVSFTDCLVKTDGCGGQGCEKTCRPGGPIGEPCRQGFFCDSGAWCQTSSGEGVCVPTKPEGATCSSLSQCDGLTFCDDLSKKCVARPVAGQPCDPYGECAPAAFCNPNGRLCETRAALNQPCSGLGRCVAGAECDFAVSPLVCHAVKPAGAVCQSTSQCEAPLGCFSGKCGARLASGDACRFSSDCASGGCDQVKRTCVDYAEAKPGALCTGSQLACNIGYYCAGAAVNTDGGVGTTGTCLATPDGYPCFSYAICGFGHVCQQPSAGMAGHCAPATVGSPCFGSYNCSPGTYCAPDAGCSAVRENGQPCERTDACRYPLACKGFPADGGSGSCSLPDPTGASCTNNRDCLFPLACVGGSCQSAGRSGDICVGGNCLGSTCQASTDGGPSTCLPFQEEGSACTLNSQCRTLHCVVGVCAGVCQ